MRLRFGAGGRSEAYGYVPKKTSSSMSSPGPVASLPRCELSARADAWEAGRGRVTRPAALSCSVYGGTGVTGGKRHGWLRAGAVHHADSQTNRRQQTRGVNGPDAAGDAVISAVQHALQASRSRNNGSSCWLSEVVSDEEDIGQRCISAWVRDWTGRPLWLKGRPSPGLTSELLRVVRWSTRR